MYKKFFCSFSFIFSVFTIIICNALWNIESNGTLYATQGIDFIQNIFFFLPLDKWNMYGLPSIFSLFYHQDSKHLAFNILFMIIVSFPYERKYGSLKTLFLFVFLHVVSLFISSFFFYENSALSGLSLATCALYSFQLTSKKHYIKLILLYLIIYFSFKSPMYTKVDVHLISIIVGSAIGLLLNKKNILPTNFS